MSRDHKGGSRHLLDIRIQAVFGRIQTRCGRFRPGQDEFKLRRAAQILYLKDWGKMVDILPVDGLKYCKGCRVSFASSDGHVEYEQYKDRI